MSAPGSTLPFRNRSYLDSKSVFLAIHRAGMEGGDPDCLFQTFRLNNEEAAKLLVRFGERTIGKDLLPVPGPDTFRGGYMIETLFLDHFSGLTERNALGVALLHNRLCFGPRGGVELFGVE